jgi:alkylated DNA repair dioxygenase AlkB
MSTSIAALPGLDYVPAYLAPEEQKRFLTIIDQQPWISDLRRRVQHYGYRYDYRRRTTNDSLLLGPLPVWAAMLAERLSYDGWIAAQPDQLTINEYVPGQGISSHVDCVPCFGDTVLSISLGSACVMHFTHIQTRQQVPILVEVGSLVAMRSESRFQWKHGIPARKTDKYEGRTLMRERRVSLTFRTVITRQRTPGV